MIFPEDTRLGKAIRLAVRQGEEYVVADDEDIKEYGQSLHIGGAHAPNGARVTQLGVLVNRKTTVGVYPLTWGEFKRITYG
jgi:hypothetical protein